MFSPFLLKAIFAADSLSGDPSSAGSLWRTAPAPAENFCGYKVGDHLVADAPPFRPLTRLRSRSPGGSNGDPLSLSGVSKGIGGQLVKLAVKPEGLLDQ